MPRLHNMQRGKNYKINHVLAHPVHVHSTSYGGDAIVNGV